MQPLALTYASLKRETKIISIPEIIRTDTAIRSENQSYYLFLFLIYFVVDRLPNVIKFLLKTVADQDNRTISIILKQLVIQL